jgi:hypothetical protein
MFQKAEAAVRSKMFCYSMRSMFSKRDFSTASLARSHEKLPMLYLVVEHFYDGAAPEISRRAREKGCMLPAGLEYGASWVALDF